MIKMAKGKKKNESRLVYIPFVALIIVIVIFFAIGFRSSSPTVSAESAFTNIVKVSSVDYAPNGTTQVYFISWYGCPYGATLSWPLYLALTHYGNVSVEPHLSLAEPDLGGAIPGLLFENFQPNSSVQFHFYYIYNQYLNATPSGQPLNGEAIQIGLQELQTSAPNWVFNLVKEYQLNKTTVLYNNNQLPIALGSPIPHLVTTLIVTGPGGTWILLGYPKSLPPSQVISISHDPSQILSEIKSGNVPSPIEATSQTIYQVIQKASES
ncbi:MAG: DUF929 domain-containing protein [Metallosphaera sp.]